MFLLQTIPRESGHTVLFLAALFLAALFLAAHAVPLPAICHVSHAHAQDKQAAYGKGKVAQGARAEVPYKPRKWANQGQHGGGVHGGRMLHQEARLMHSSPHLR